MTLSLAVQARFPRLTLAALCVAASTLAGAAAETVVFGPETFTRGQGAPVTSTRAFRIAAPSPTYVLRIENRGVTSAVVSLNGRPVLQPADFRRSDASSAAGASFIQHLERPVDLIAGENHIAVQLRSSPGSALIVEIVDTAAVVDTTPPVITSALSPLPNAAGWHNTDVTVTFTCSDGGSGVAACPAPVTVSAEGANQVVAGTSTDLAGNTSTTSVTVNVDKTAPTLTVALTPSASGWINTFVAARFSCADALSGVVTCPDPQVIATEGPDQTVTASVVDQAGNQTSVTSAPFSIDLRAPAVTVTLSPPPNANGWNNSAVTVHFNCLDNSAEMATCPADQVISTEGANQIVSGTAVDAAGNSVTATATVSLDMTPPLLTVAAPAAVFSADAPLSGIVSDALSGVFGANCNALPAVIAPSQFTCSLFLAPGANTVVVTATDRAGNSASADFSLQYVRVPKVTITSPSHLSYLNISPTTVTGTVDEPSASVTINSISVPVLNGAFSMPLPIAEGPNTVTATATTTEGAVGTASIAVTLDTTPPRVTVTTPTDQFVTAEGTISIAGIVNDIVVGTVNDQDAQVTVNGAQAAVANRTFLATAVPLVVGSNTVQVIARDRVGNSATTEITVVRQPLTAPQIRLVSGNNQRGPIGSLLQEPAVVVLTNAAGQPVADMPVIFKVTQNDGLVTAEGPSAATVIATTNGEGKASAVWTLGNRAGAGGNVLEAYAVGFEGTSVFTATGTLGVPAKIVIDTGNDQIGATGEPLPKPFIAVVVDTGNNRIGGVPVTFTVTGGGGGFDGQPAFTAVSDSDGRVAATLTLGQQEGNANNVVAAAFEENSAFPAVFSASGRVPGNPAETSISGVVLDNSNLPVPGVTVRAVSTSALRSSLAVVQAATAVQTNDAGQFVIPQAPVGLVKLMVDGTTVELADGRHYPALEYDIVTVAGQQNDVGQPIYILPISTANQLCVSATTGGGTLTVPEAPGFSLTFSPGQVTFPGGSQAGCISVTVVNGDKVPMVPGFGQQPRFVVTIQPAGAVFNPPATITLPNVDGLAPRAVTEMYSFDHDIGAFVAIGTAVVSDDGLVLRSSPGVGVLKAGWHCGGDPNTTGTAATCPTCQTCEGTQCVPDNGQTPPPTPNDCKKEKCNNGSVTTENDDSDHDANSCCFNGETQAKQPITDLAKCPNRVPGPWTYDYDGCSLQPLPASIRNNPAGGFSTLFSDAHLPNPTYQYACDHHDRCYQQCGGQDLTAAQEICDSILRDIAMGTCADSLLNPLDLLSGDAVECFAFAQAYYTGLSPTGLNFGKSAYETRQKQVCKCC